MRRFYESEENEIDFHQAAADALPMCSPKAQDEIGNVAQNYFDESEYDSEEELSNLIYNYIDNMADSGEFTEETKLDLINAGYIESDEELEESVLNEVRNHPVSDDDIEELAKDLVKDGTTSKKDVEKAVGGFEYFSQLQDEIDNADDEDVDDLQKEYDDDFEEVIDSVLESIKTLKDKKSSKGKKSLKEDVSGEKSFDEVKEGDIGKDYAGNEVIILAKGPASNFNNADGFEEFVDLSDYDPEDTDFNNQIDAEWPECVLVQFVEDGSEVVYSYGSDGVLVPQSKVRQISFDFIDNGVDVESLISRIKDAMEVAGIEIVGGPQVGDTSWTKEEYGLKESAKLKEAEGQKILWVSHDHEDANEHNVFVISPKTLERINATDTWLNSFEYIETEDIIPGHQYLIESDDEILSIHDWTQLVIDKKKEAGKDDCPLFVDWWDWDYDDPRKHPAYSSWEEYVEANLKYLDEAWLDKDSAFGYALISIDKKGNPKQILGTLDCMLGNNKDVNIFIDEALEEGSDLDEEIIGRGKYGIEVKDPRDLWVPASENYPRNGEPAEFKKEDDAKNSDLYKRLVDRYGKDRVRTYKQDKPRN